MKTIEASAPSNIALIKYMGKIRTESNLPTNASLSYTLENLRSFVTLESNDTGVDEWKPLAGFAEFKLSEVGLEKFLKHFAFLKSAWKISGHYVVRSANNFPSDCGLASSASSFAALTRAAAELAKSLHGLDVSLDMLSQASRLGSGSSCRSFFSPWAVWRDEGAKSVNLNLRLEHAVILVEESRKAVSSSQAHRRITTSALFAGRVERAEVRLSSLLSALQENRWAEAYELCWSEFWDMHALFETSVPAFGYMQPQTLRVLQQLRGIWEQTGDGPLVTMDAGANVHILIRKDQVDHAKNWLVGFKTLASWQ